MDAQTNEQTDGQIDARMDDRMRECIGKVARAMQREISLPVLLAFSLPSSSLHYIES